MNPPSDDVSSIITMPLNKMYITTVCIKQLTTIYDYVTTMILLCASQPLTNCPTSIYTWYFVVFAAPAISTTDGRRLRNVDNHRRRHLASRRQLRVGSRRQAAPPALHHARHRHGDARDDAYARQRRLRGRDAPPGAQGEDLLQMSAVADPRNGAVEVWSDVGGIHRAVLQGPTAGQRRPLRLELLPGNGDGKLAF